MRKEQIIAPPTLFYSYTHEDKTLRDQLEKHLRQLQRQGLISTWHNRQIPAGREWAHEIDTHLETASIILLLVSPDFLASDYCYEHEMQRALERHKRGEARLIPIILRPCDWQHTPLQDLPYLPRDGRPVTQWPDQDEAFNIITQHLRRIIEQQPAVAHPPLPLSPLHRQNRIRMLRQVQTIWIDGLLTQSLHHAVVIELSLQDRPDVLANPWRLQVQELNQPPHTLPAGTSIVQVYDGAEGELLILGEPGAGKTTLLLELTRTLLQRAEQNEQLPMPIVFHLSSWAEKRQPLNAWLVEELATKYQVPRKIGQTWIEADRVLPLLDGLDEVAKEARTACVEQINNYYQSRLERGSSPIVICCRSEEYTALSTPLTLQHAVSILPLTDEQITTYLEQTGEQVKGLKQALDEDSELHHLARQPLMLNIFTFAYQGVQASEIPTGASREEMQHTIFAKYVEHMLKRRGQSKRWKPEQVIGYLTFLAQQMQQHDQTVFSVENLQPTWLSKKWRLLYQWCVGLTSGLVGALICGLIVGLVSGLVGDLGDNLVAGLVAGQVVGLVTGLLSGLNNRITPAEALTWSSKKALRGLFFGLGGGSVVGLILGLFFELGLLGGLVGWLAGGLSGKPLPEHLSLSPNEGIWRSGKNGLVVVGLGIGLGGGLGSAVGNDLPTKLVPGLSIGMILGLILGLLVGLGAFVKHFVLRFLLTRRDDLPWDLIPFLDEAAQRLLLRKVGGIYVFVHRLLLDYFVEIRKDE